MITVQLGDCILDINETLEAHKPHERKRHREAEWQHMEIQL